MRRSLLIVDDDIFMATLLVNSFSDTFKLRVANTFEEVKNLPEDFAPDLIILDYFLPDSTGDTSYISVTEQFPSAVVIVLSANDSKENLNKLIKLGVRNYVVKDESAIDEIKAIIEDEISL